jgi:hypothetical protein
MSKLPDDRTPLQRLVAPPQVYRHYKGNYYSVVAISRHSETLEWLVTYRLVDKDTAKSSEAAQFWTRPLVMFVENMPDGSPRFERKR